MKLPAKSVVNRRDQSAFTMVEIAISLGVIGFALVAIIGILPAGMKVQKENREETIINQDARTLVDAIQTGARGWDDLTNYVVAITNFFVDYNDSFKPGNPPQRLGYTRTNSTVAPQFPINTGARIVGLLSTPKYISLPNPRGLPFFRSNYLVAYVRALSGTANEKVPQTNSAIQELGFNYRVNVDVVPYANYDPFSTNYVQFAVNTQDYANHFNQAIIAKTLQNNVHDVRLTFLWPLLPNGNVGKGFQSYRKMVGGALLETEEPGFPANGIPAKLPWTLFFFQPNTYVTSP
jgi:type II secretory pathway pseudopilin PulG